MPDNYVVDDGRLYKLTLDKKGMPSRQLVADQMLSVVEVGEDYERAQAATRTLAYRTALGNGKLNRCRGKIPVTDGRFTRRWERRRS